MGSKVNSFPSLILSPRVFKGCICYDQEGVGKVVEEGVCSHYCCLWLPQSPQLILHNQPALTNFWKMRAIDGILEWKRGWSMDTFSWKRGWRGIDHRSTSFQGAAACRLFTSELRKLRSRLSKDEIAKFRTRDFGKKSLNERNARVRKTYCSMDVMSFLRSICKKKKMFVSWNRTEE